MLRSNYPGKQRHKVPKPQSGKEEKMDNGFRKMEINSPGWDMMKTALELYNIYYLDEFLNNPEYVEICRACGLQGNEKRAIAITICEIEAQQNGSEMFKISLQLAQWQLISNILADFYESVVSSADTLDIQSESGKIINLDIKQEDWDDYLSNLETLLDALAFLTEENTAENPGVVLN